MDYSAEEILDVFDQVRIIVNDKIFGKDINQFQPQTDRGYRFTIHSIIFSEGKTDCPLYIPIDKLDNYTNIYKIASRGFTFTNYSVDYVLEEFNLSDCICPFNIDTLKDYEALVHMTFINLKIMPDIVNFIQDFNNPKSAIE